MIDSVTKFILWVRQRSFFRAVQRTLVMLMPIAVLGSYFSLLHDSVFTPDGIIYNIFNLDAIMSDHVWYGGAFVCQGMVQVTFGVFGVYAAYFAAHYTARLYQKDSTMAGMTAVIAILFCAYANTVGNVSEQQSPFSSSLLRVNGVFIALLIGYGVGQVFHWLGNDYAPVRYEHAHRIQRRSWNALIPISVSIGISIILGVLIYELQIKMLNSGSFKLLVRRIQGTNNLGEVLLLSVVVMFLSWLGIGYPLNSLSTSINSGYTADNLTYALQRGNSWNVPYKFLGSSLINTYGTMGGASIVLAVIVIVLLRKEHKEIESIAQINLLPVAFTSVLGFAVGMPIILNPLFMLPMIIIPLINMTLAAGAIAVHFIPVCVYPVLKGTPGILIAFFGTNGNWTTLLFSLLLFVIDVLILIPIIRIGEKVELNLEKENRRNDLNAQKS